MSQQDSHLHLPVSHSPLDRHIPLSALCIRWFCHESSSSNICSSKSRYGRNSYVQEYATYTFTNKPLNSIGMAAKQHQQVAYIVSDMFPIITSYTQKWCYTSNNMCIKEFLHNCNHQIIHGPNTEARVNTGQQPSRTCQSSSTSTVDEKCGFSQQQNYKHTEAELDNSSQS